MISMIQKPKTVEEKLESSEKISVGKLKLEELYQNVDLDKLIAEIFEVNKILFKTTKKTYSYYPKEFSFLAIYKAKLTELNVKESSEATINNHFRELEKKGFIIQYDQDMHDAWFKDDPSMPFSYSQITWILRGAKVSKDRSVDASSIKERGAKSILRILNKNPKEILVSTINSKISGMIGTAAQEFKEALAQQVGIREQPSTYLETFERQRLFEAGNKYNLRLYAKDLVAYMENRLERVCDCGYRLYSIEAIEQKGELSFSLGGESEEQKTKNKVTEEIAKIDPALKFEVKVLEDSVEIQFLQIPPKEKVDQINATLSKEISKPVVVKEQSKTLASLDHNGGLFAIDPLTKLDVLIYKKTRYANFYYKNSTRSAWSKNAIDKKQGASTNISEDELEAIQAELETELTCPVCHKLLVKLGFYKVEKFITEAIDAIEEGIPFVFVGYPGDGKSSLCEFSLRYFKWRYGYNYEVYNISEATTAGKLTGRLNMLKIFQPEKEEIPNALYGIFTLCLLKQGWRKMGFGANLMLDELNRCEFKQIAFLMSFLASPYLFTIDDDNYRKVYYPNRRGESKRWILNGTMNTEDINNEDISIAAKSRFAFITVTYSIEDLKVVIQSHFNLDTTKDPVILYLMQIYDMTQTLRGDHSVRFPAGIRHLIRIQEMFQKVMQTRIKTYPVKSLLDWKQLGEPENIIESITANTLGKTFSDSDVIPLLDEIVSANLINVISDENSPSRKDAIKEAWIALSQQNSDFIKNVMDALKSFT
jgi:MoxR-like ATPase